MESNNEEQRVWSCCLSVVMVIYAVAALALIALLAGCSRRSAAASVSAPVVLDNSRVRSDTLFIVRDRHDTVRLSAALTERLRERDSIAPIVGEDGRVTGFDRWHFRERETASANDRESYLAAADTVYLAVRDTVRLEVPVPYPVERRVEVERNPTWGEKIRLRGFPWMLGLAVVLGVWTFRSPLKRILKRIFNKN